MMIRRSSPGTTLSELMFVLMLLSILLGLSGTRLKRGLDEHAVRAARDALAAQLARTRAAAVARGGAWLVLDLSRGTCWIETMIGERVGAPAELEREFRVTIEVDGAGTNRVELRYDALGIGRMVNRTIRVRRGGAEAGLTLSTYGRVRRW